MRRARDLQAMRQVVEIRGTQTMAAQMDVAVAATTLRKAQAGRDVSELELKSREAGWAASVAVGSLDLAGMALWTASILQGEDALRQSQNQVHEAATLKAEREKGWAKARAHTDAVEGLFRTGLKSAARRRDEALSAELADRSARRSK